MQKMYFERRFLAIFGCWETLLNAQYWSDENPFVFRRNFKTIPPFNVRDYYPNENHIRSILKMLTKELFQKYRCYLSAKKIDKISLPNTLVKINNKNTFFTSVLNAHAKPKTINFQNILNPKFFSYLILFFSFKKNHRTVIMKL